MGPFSSKRELKQWALSIVAVAFAYVDFDGSIWAYEVHPDGRLIALRLVRSSGVYA